MWLILSIIEEVDVKNHLIKSVLRIVELECLVEVKLVDNTEWL
jgi:hypothetical protein